MSYLDSNDIDFAAITETWLTDDNNHVTSIIKDYGYEIMNVNRTNRKGGGVAILYKNVKVTRAKKLMNVDSFEYIFCTVKLSNHSDINVICVYRPGSPQTGVSEFCEELESVLHYHLKDDDFSIVLGDFNIHYEVDNSSKYNLWSSTVNFDLTQLVPCIPTHIAGHTLDLVFANTRQLDINIHDIDIPFSPPDHFPIRFDISKIEKYEKKPNVVRFRKFEDIDIENLKKDLVSKLNNFIEDNTLNEFESEYDNLAIILSETLNKYAPLRSKTIRSQRPQWMDSSFNKERALRRKFERKYLKTRSSEDKKAFQEQRILCTKLSKMKRSEYYGSLLREAEGDQRKLFNIVSKTLDCNPTRGVLPEHTSETDLAASFNNFYIEKVQKIRDDLPNINLDDSVFVDFQGTTLDAFQPITIEELQDIIKEIKIKTCHNDPLPSPILKNVIECILPYFCHLINKSFDTCSLNGIKESVIRPLLKKAGLDTDALNSYRPVHNLVFLSKLMEKVVIKQFNDHIARNNLDLKFQHGYKKYHSTETLILRVVDDVLIGFEKGTATVMVMIDLSAAFDTVDIDKLLYILKREIGVRGKALSWFANYLKNRKQTVMTNDTVSDPLFVLFGVPQGSVLGPTLFNIYIRSLSRMLNNCKYVTGGYADDNHAMQSFPLSMQFNVLSSDIPQIISSITLWMKKFALKINPDKTEIIVFRPQNPYNPITINGTILADGTCVRFSNSAKNLGVYLDSALNLRTHIDNVSSHCYSLLRNIGRIKGFLSQKQLEMLIHAVISSRIDYCNSIFFGIDKYLIETLQKVQNAALRMIYGLKKRTHLSEYYDKLHWLKVEQRIYYKIILTVFKCINDIAPIELIERIVTFRDRDKLILSQVHFNSKLGRRSFTYIAPRLWNEVPYDIKTISDINRFKSKLKCLLYGANFTEFKARVFKYID